VKALSSSPSTAKKKKKRKKPNPYLISCQPNKKPPKSNHLISCRFFKEKKTLSCEQTEVREKKSRN
jgi:hypothetical protein